METLSLRNKPMDVLEYIDIILNEKVTIQRKGLSKPVKRGKVTKGETFPKKKKLPLLYKRLQAANKLALAMQFGSIESKTKVRKSVCRKYPDLQICKETRYKRSL